MSVRVLVVDDFALMRDGIAAALEVDPRIEIVGLAADGTEGFELTRELAPDVVVLDLRMSERGGLETLELCSEHAPATKVLILTANENPSNLDAAMAAGAAGYLTKGVDPGELREAVVAVHRGERVLAPALAGRSRPGAGAPGELTARERRILRLLSRGMTDREIAAELFVGVRTVQYDLSSVRRKTGIASRSELSRWAVIHALD
ncbi:MAG: response regulator transcription factor [Thermoleophilia bacterium]|nr:response regulator transcription factor [Thermoleophilia bacterium]GIK77466.1 MAG: DNA-binding response regulator [Actinomycetes bacterium]